MGILKQMTRKVLSSLLACIISTVIFANPVVTDITAKQRFPWNGLVDITLTLSGTEEECKAATWEFYATNKATNAAMPVANVNEVGTATGEGSQWTRRFVWNATEDLGKAKFGEVVLSVSAWKPSLTGVQLWKDGPFWADCNVGATKPEESGYYFWWGDTVGYKRNDANNGWVSVKDGSSFSFSDENAPTYNKVKSQLQSMGYVDSFGNLVSAHDAATAQWGVGWRMPTDSEFRALISNCKTVWTTRNGVYGWFITGTDAYASKHIFLPAVGRGSRTSLDSLGSDGYYWSSTMDTYYTTYAAWLLHFNSSETIRPCEYRSLGQPVRSVRVLAQ